MFKILKKIVIVAGAEIINIRSGRKFVSRKRFIIDPLYKKFGSYYYETSKGMFRVAGFYVEVKIAS